MEMPVYHWPKLKSMWQHTWERVRGFIIKAGTIIFVASAILWILQNFNTSFIMVKPEESMMADIGRLIAPLFVPLGFGTWQTAFAAIGGFIAKEVIVSTFGILAGVADPEKGGMLMQATVQSMFTPASGYAFMVFILLASPCIAAIATIRREMGSWGWTLAALSYQTGLAYVIALLVYQIGSRI
jgi:ferrous iron transport protein B